MPALNRNPLPRQPIKRSVVVPEATVTEDRFDAKLEGVVLKRSQGIGSPFSSIKFEWSDMSYASMYGLEVLLGEFYAGLLKLGGAKVTKT